MPALSAPSSAEPPAFAASLPVFDPASDWAALYGERDEAWRDLAVHWVLALPPGEPCDVALRQRLGCYRSSTGTLALLKHLDRPVVLKLVARKGRPGRVMLLGLNAQQARIAVGQRQWTLPVDQLERLWRGEYGTLWRMPADFTRPLAQGDTGPAAEALAHALATQAGAPAPAPGSGLDGVTRERLMAMQRAHGLPELGRAGPTSFMMLNRMLGVVEPRLVLE